MTKQVKRRTRLLRAKIPLMGIYANIYKDTWKAEISDRNSRRCITLDLCKEIIETSPCITPDPIPGRFRIWDFKPLVLEEAEGTYPVMLVLQRDGDEANFVTAMPNSDGITINTSCGKMKLKGGQTKNEESQKGK